MDLRITAVITKPESLKRCLSVPSLTLLGSVFALLPWHPSVSSRQSVFVFLLKASSPEPKAAQRTVAAAEPESQDEVFGKGSNHMLILNLHTY